MRMRNVAAILVVVAVVVVVAALFLSSTFPFQKKAAPNAALAPDFTLADIYGHNFTLSHYRNNDVVVIEFTSLSCSSCQIVEHSLASFYASSNQTGHSNVQMISVFVNPQFGDTVPALKGYHDKNGVTWTMAPDTQDLVVSTAYGGVADIPVVIVVDKQGHAVYDASGPDSGKPIPSVTASALAGKSAPISIVTASVFGLAAVAGLSTFFSPCAFPMFPGYMSLFLGLNASRAKESNASAPAYKGAVRRALSAGSVTALGMMIVFLLIGVALIFAASVVGGYVPYFLVIVGVVLVGLGLLLLTNLQYWKIVTPLQTLWRRLRGSPAGEAPIVASPADGKGFYLKLFGYGMGYAAAAAGCVAPVILAAIVAGMALGLLSGIISILIYSLTAAVLMIVVTVMLSVAGEKYVNQLKAYTPVIKKVSAVALLLVGVYLVYYYYAAWVVR